MDFVLSAECLDELQRQVFTCSSHSYCEARDGRLGCRSRNVAIQTIVRDRRNTTWALYTSLHPMLKVFDGRTYHLPDFDIENPTLNDFSMLTKILLSRNIIEDMIVLLWLLCASTVAQIFPENTCFAPNGVASQTMRCSNTSEACCPAGWGCTTSGLCTQELDDGSLATVRGSCTVQDWDSGTCASVCQNGKLFLNAFSQQQI